MPVSKDVLDLILKWDQDWNDMQSIVKQAINEILGDFNAYSTTDIQHEIDNYVLTESNRHTALHGICVSNLATLFRHSPRRLENLLNDMVESEDKYKDVKSVELEIEDRPVWYYYKTPPKL